MDRIVNYVFLFLLISIAFLKAGTVDRIQISLALLAGLLIGLSSFMLNWLTLDGAVAAALLGGITFGLGGWEAAVIVLGFFISSNLLSRIKRAHTGAIPERDTGKIRRDGRQVWANGFWFSFFIICAYLAEYEWFLVAAVGSIAVAISDTWATELGSTKFGGTTYLITNFRKVEPGTEGGISFYGTLGAVGGGLFISVLFFFIYSSSVNGLISVFLAGFSGCFLDSYLGATLQQRGRSMEGGSLLRKIGFESDNNFVNWAATGFGSLAAVTLNLLMI